MTVCAQDQLYDQEPPADSSYVRVIHIVPDGTVDVLVDGSPRIHKLTSGTASEYLVLPAGKHTLALQTAGKVRVSTGLEIDSGHLITMAFSSLRTDAKPLIFDDKANSNKLKAVLAVYNLDIKSGPLDLLTANGNARVFSNITPGTSTQLSVNPIPKIELIATKTGDKAVLARTNISMSPGGSYSLLLLPSSDAKLTVYAVQNKIERYTGK
jgi:hypothetical protein